MIQNDNDNEMNDEEKKNSNNKRKSQNKSIHKYITNVIFFLSFSTEDDTVNELLKWIIFFYYFDFL